MPQYLTFALIAPLAAFGGIAVGERRSGWNRPARSAVLGLIGACLGLEREDTMAQEALSEGYGLALLCHAPGRLLADYHTTQIPSTQRDRRFATRAEELHAPALNTVLSRRDYRSGAWHLGALWQRDMTACWPLDALAEAMRNPAFTPYLGRKSCPLGLPLAPVIIEAMDAPAALQTRHVEGPEAQLGVGCGISLRQILADLPSELIIAMDAPNPDSAPGDAGHVANDDPRRRRIEQRRDQPRSRSRWQFDLRNELLLGIVQE